VNTRLSYQTASTPSESELARAYDGSNVTYRLLRAFGWGPLLNLGYYPFPRPFTALNFILTPGVLAPHFRLPLAQMRLVKKALDLLDVRPRQRVLDVGCGRGAGSFMIAGRYPDVTVTGIDILPGNVHAAHTFYGNKANLSYLEGDATSLPFQTSSCERVLCLEAAFHFPDRSAFLREAARVLAPDGRLVVVDFVWKTPSSAQEVSADFTDLVRSTWQWENFASIGEYESQAQDCGLSLAKRSDWSGHVTDPLQTVFQLVAWLARRRWGQKLAETFNPLLRSMTPGDWQGLEQSAVAHTAVRKHSRYVAFVFDRRS